MDIGASGEILTALVSDRFPGDATGEPHRSVSCPERRVAADVVGIVRGRYRWHIQNARPEHFEIIYNMPL